MYSITVGVYATYNEALKVAENKSNFFHGAIRIKKTRKGYAVICSAI